MYMARSVTNLPLQGNWDLSQENDVHGVFKSYGYGVWIPLPKFPHLHEFNRAVHNLRWRDDLNIQNRTERVSRPDGRKGTDSFYRLLPGSWRELRGKPEKDGDTRQERVARFEREFRPAVVPTAASTTEEPLPLFAEVRR